MLANYRISLYPELSIIVAPIRTDQRAVADAVTLLTNIPTYQQQTDIIFKFVSYFSI